MSKFRPLQSQHTQSTWEAAKANPLPRLSPNIPGNVKERSLWQSYAVLPARTRLYFSLGICTIGVAGIAISNWLEEVVPTEEMRATNHQVVHSTSHQSPAPNNTKTTA